MFFDLNGLQFGPKITQCLYHIILGKTTKEIAYDLELSHRTVEEYILIIKKALNCTSKSQIMQRLLIQPDNKNTILDFFQSF